MNSSLRFLGYGGSSGFSGSERDEKRSGSIECGLSPRPRGGTTAQVTEVASARPALSRCAGTGARESSRTELDFEPGSAGDTQSNSPPHPLRSLPSPSKGSGASAAVGLLGSALFQAGAAVRGAKAKRPALVSCADR